MRVNIGSRCQRDGEELCSARGDVDGGHIETRTELEAAAGGGVRVALARETRQPAIPQPPQQTTTQAAACAYSSGSPNERSRSVPYNESTDSDERRE